MFKRRIKTEVVPIGEYTDYSDRFIGDEKYATLRHVTAAASIPVLMSVGTGLYIFNKFNDAHSSVVVPVNAPLHHPILEPVATQIPTTISTVPVNAIAQPTGVIADKSLEMLATILDPVIQVLVAISFPVSSVIMVGACFFFMFGNSERAWNTIMNAGLGYVLIQMSPLVLDIFRTVGKAVQ